ncbi:MAG: single-stranded-DNA-specific exonuclease RecJ [Candidatus Omnitrophica bacterium]|nr:single-stranded-DNA-specific exonuclease RecJ [Candidatus Omnitrophota bacterium]
MQKIWKIKPKINQESKLLAEKSGISLVLAQILINRGINTPADAKKYLNCDLNELHDPFLFKDMAVAVKHIRNAIKLKKNIVVYGDYDVDGLTSCAVLFNVLKQLGAKVSCYIPHRVDEGYGLNKQACAQIKQQQADLLITVDCGISAFEQVAYANSLELEVIITDHHQPVGKKVPQALAVINPFQAGCDYPYKHLAGVGIAYKLACALVGPEQDISENLDLVALGTICDVAMLTGENRILVKHGLEKLSYTQRIGLLALKDVAGINNKKVEAYHVGFILGPRINATGRMGSAEKALELLLSNDYAQAIVLAQALDNENKQRQKEEAKTLRQALAMVDREINFKTDKAVVLHNDAWHPGVIGIVASRITERFYRPTILISTKEEIAKGSGRSIRNFHLFETIAKCEHLLEGFGGHEKAAGLSILKNNIESFKQSFNQLASSSLLPEDMMPLIEIDMQIPLSALSESLINEIEKCAPFGMGNTRPLFSSVDLKVKGAPKALRASGFKMWITDGQVTCEALASNFSDIDISHIQDGFAIVYSPSINDWQGINTIQLKLKDLQLS